MLILQLGFGPALGAALDPANPSVSRAHVKQAPSDAVRRLAFVSFNRVRRAVRARMSDLREFQPRSACRICTEEVLLEARLDVLLHGRTFTSGPVVISSSNTLSSLLSNSRPLMIIGLTSMLYRPDSYKQIAVTSSASGLPTTRTSMSASMLSTY